MRPQTAEARLDRWLYLNPDYSGTVPRHVAADVDVLCRRESARSNMSGATLVSPKLREQAAQIRATVEAGLAGYARRRAAELELSEYISEVGSRLGDGELAALAEKLTHCRQNGALGIRPDGRPLIAWDEKCRVSRLCPDESREETNRLAERYTPAVLDWIAGGKGRRAQYLVFTAPNVPHGELAAGKRELLARVKEFLFGNVAACPVAYGINRDEGRRVVLSSRKRTLRRFPAVEGAFVCEEDPLSGSGGGWNVHVNAIVLIDGAFDWKFARSEWGGNLHFQSLGGTVEEIAEAIRELVKYSARAVSEKSAEKSASGMSPAPAMVEWSDAEFSEWWAAQKGFRRTRTYGALYKVEKPAPEVLEWDQIVWAGAINWDGRGYRLEMVRGASDPVGFIPADNSGSSARDAGGEVVFLEGGGQFRPPDCSGLDEPEWMQGVEWL